MSYIVEQKIKGRIYLYEVESYWDSKLKQPRQKRKYLGRKKEDYQQSIKNTLGNISVKILGDVYLLQSIADKLDLERILSKVFPSHYKEILAIAYYQITQASPSYLFHYWLDEHHLPGVKSLDSTAISEFFQDIGKSKDKILEFQYQWVEKLQPIEAVYYDITSISSYGTNNDYIEWGYNRDGEQLPQVNMGVICCSKTSLPIIYRLYCGSIVDVTTLKNTVNYLKAFGVKDFMCIMDRGFYSNQNIIGMNNPENGIRFIQPIPYTTKMARELVTSNKRELSSSYNAFTYNEELLYYVNDEYVIDQDNKFDAHIYFNEKSMVDQKQALLQKVIEIFEKLKGKPFKNRKHFNDYLETEIPAGIRDYFKWVSSEKICIYNNKAIERTISRMGTFIIITNNKGLNKEKVLSYYRRKDAIEKMFDLVKNEMDGNRLRVHSGNTTDGSMFVRFVALILYSEIARILKENDLYKKFTVREMFAELRKIKLTSLKDQGYIVSELTKRHKQILDAFNIEINLS